MPLSVPLQKICPVCSKQFETRYRKQTNCSRRCGNLGRGPRSEEYNAKISDGLKKYFREHPVTNEQKDRFAKHAGEYTKGKHNKSPKSILELSKRTVHKIMKRLKVGCSSCGWNECACDIHHINGRKIENADSHKNLAYLCPNCHRMAHAGKLKNVKTLEESVGDDWLKHYYG